VSPAVRTSACVDCGTPLIGDRLRCPACHAVLEASRDKSLGQVLLAWLVFVEIFAAVICGLVLASRGCA